MELIEEVKTVFKNKKILLSSVAIIFALVVSAIFVNFTLANSGSSTSDISAQSGDNATLQVSKRTNIDWAIANSNDANKKKKGQDKYRIVQIVPNSASSKAAVDMQMKADSEAGNSVSDTGATWLGKYVYSGEYFRRAVFNGYKSEGNSELMAKGAVSLSTFTVSDLNKMDATAQAALNQADFVYIWADSATSYGSAGDLSEDLYNWLDAFATSDSHPIAICEDALCTSNPGNISGNNDEYRMGALAYKLMTKNLVARYDNVLVTKSDFFETLYNEAKKNDGGTTPAPTGKTNYTLTDFILRARPVSEGGANYIGLNTYYKWYDGVDLIDFLERTNNDPLGKGDTTYVKARDRSGTTGDKSSWKYDHAKILVISEKDDSKMFNEMKDINDNTDTRESKYTYDSDSATWKSVEAAPNSELTSHMYSQGRADDSLGLSPYVPSGAEIYQISSFDIKEAITDGTKGFKTSSMPNSHYMDVKTKNISGKVTTTNKLIDMSAAKAYLLIENVQKDADGKVVSTTVSPAGMSAAAGDEYEVPLTYVKEEKIDDDGQPILDENGNPIVEEYYTYEFKQLNYDYNYRVVISIPETVTSDVDGSDIKCIAGVSSLTGESGNDDTNLSFDFNVMLDGETPAEGYIYRTETDPSNNKNTYMLPVTLKNFQDNVASTLAGNDLGKTYTSQTFGDYVDFSTEAKVTAYVDKCYNDYLAQQRNLINDAATGKLTEISKLKLTDYDFIFIDAGDYFPAADATDEEIAKYELGKDVFNQFVKAIEGNLYFIVSSEAGVETGSGKQDDDNSGNTGDEKNSVIKSPLAKPVADVINAGVYRDGYDNKFKVLEIQPDYPIDLKLAASKTPTDKTKSAYTTRSDGTQITGDYYTVPSDVVSGKAKEEIAEGVEYYDFDLTKAKIAHALQQTTQYKQYGYSNIDITQVSTEALIGMNQNILATYDLIYIGGDISAVDRNIEDVYGYAVDFAPGGDKGVRALAYALPTFIMYTHTGMLERVGSNKMPSELYAGETTFIPENGNDLTKSKYEEILSYITANRPVIVSSELTSVYEKMKGLNVENAQELSQVQLLQGYWYKDDGQLERKNYYLDPSSRMYQLVDNIYERYSQTSTASAGAAYHNVWWGFDPAQTRNIDNTDGKYGKTVTTYAVAMSTSYEESLNSLLENSAGRVKVILSDKPTSYQQGIEDTYLDTKNLEFSFTVDGSASSYKYRLYVDKDKNTIFDSTDYHSDDTAQNNELTTVSIPLDDNFFGSAYWKLEITDSTGNNVLASYTDVCKINKSVTEKSDIKVLQVQTNYMNDGGSFDNPADMLYFDILSQRSHRIMYYNGVPTGSKKGSQQNVSQNSVFGRHDNVFGIVKYDADIVNNGVKGDDDWYSNLADVLTDEYDIDLDMVVATEDKTKFTASSNNGDITGYYECLDKWVEEAETLEAGGAVEVGYGITDKLTKAQYAAGLSAVESDYNAAVSAVSAPKTAIDEYLQKVIYALDGKTGYDLSTYSDFLGGFGSGISNAEKKEVLEYCLKYSQYYAIFDTYYRGGSGFGGESSLDSYGAYKDLFIAYRDAKDAELNARDIYMAYKRRANGRNFLNKMYSILVLGPSDDFGNYTIDLKPKTCEYIKNYVSNGGDLFFFHDTMTAYNDKGAVNLTKTLLDVVGMNRYHVDLNNPENTYDITKKYAGLTEAHPAGIGYGTLEEDGYIYAKEEYDVTYNYLGPINGWSDEKYNLYSIKDKYNIDYRRKFAKAGTKGYIMMPEYSGGEKIFKNTYEYKNNDTSKYYLTPYAFNPNLNETLGVNESAVLNVSGTGYGSGDVYSNLNVSALSMGQLNLAQDNNNAKGKFSYVYAKMDYESALRKTVRDGNHEESGLAQTAKASRLNKGLVTLYPFSIGDSLNISGTHQQAYSLDFESPNTTVWYTLAGCNNSDDNGNVDRGFAKTASSYYAADPYDGMENYFIYTTAYNSGAVTYCGAGHTSVTGSKTKNNDERKLFINVIVNSANALINVPTIKAYEPDQKFADSSELPKNKVALSNGMTVYEKTVDSKTDTPEFDMKVTIPDGTKLTRVNVYYDIGYEDPTYRTKPGFDKNEDGTDKDVMIKSYTRVGTGDDQVDLKTIQNELRDMLRGKTDESLKLQETYFNSSQDAYIVIEVYYEGKATPAFVMIKINAGDPLFNLTENTIDSIGDCVAERRYCGA